MKNLSTLGQIINNYTVVNVSDTPIIICNHMIMKYEVLPYHVCNSGIRALYNG